MEPGQGNRRFRFPCLFVMKKEYKRCQDFMEMESRLPEKVLDYLWGRQNITLNNIANDDTPGFKSQQVTLKTN